jgi:hypothetical protein
MPDDDRGRVVNRLKVSGDLTREETEALLLELRHLARRHGLTMRELPVGQEAEDS